MFRLGTHIEAKSAIRLPESRSAASLERGASYDRDRSHDIATRLSASLSDKVYSQASSIASLAVELLNSADREILTIYSDLLIRCCIFFFETGQSTIGISVARQTGYKAESLGNIPVQRRVANTLGGQYCDVADFASAMEQLEVAVVLARQLGDATIEAACLANVIAVLQEMGHYRQAVLLAERVLRLKDDSHLAQMLKLQCTSNGLFAAHRVGDSCAAARFLSEGQTYLNDRTEPLRRAFFEKGRAWYLVDLGRVAEADLHLAETRIAIGTQTNPRIQTLLTVSSALCDWGLGEKSKARTALRELHAESSTNRLYHHFVLQALIKVFADSSTPSEVSIGLAYARELVEYTTSVKKAKFYKQLANKREQGEQRSGSLLSTTAIDPFDSVKNWLNTSDITGPMVESPTGERRELAKHDELTAIHDDMARLRAKSIRRDIRTEAVDTAENWAIAAEFFDDETGQHCYRVGHLASLLARELGLAETFCVQVEHAARLHDIGKIAVNEVILLKPGPLDASEMAAMRLHTEVGAQILSGSDDPTLKMATEVARHHHEWWNGSGYPAKLTGCDIPISARVCAFADVYDALTHARSYKIAWTHERALDEIERLAGTQFDPGLMAPFHRALKTYRGDLESGAIPGFVDMDANSLIASRRKLLNTIAV